MTPPGSIADEEGWDASRSVHMFDSPLRHKYTTEIHSYMHARAHTHIHTHTHTHTHAQTRTFSHLYTHIQVYTQNIHHTLT